MGALWLSGDVGVRKRILKLLHQKGRTLAALHGILMEYRANLGRDGGCFLRLDVLCEGGGSPGSQLYSCHWFMLTGGDPCWSSQPHWPVACPCVLGSSAAGEADELAQHMATARMMHALGYQEDAVPDEAAAADGAGGEVQAARGADAGAGPLEGGADAGAGTVEVEQQDRVPSAAAQQQQRQEPQQEQQHKKRPRERSNSRDRGRDRDRPDQGRARRRSRSRSREGRRRASDRR